MRAVVVRIACGLLLGVVPVGCGHDVAVPDQLDGGDVSSMAEHELEAENPRLAPGRLSCPDLALRVGASVRCRRTTELTAGRVVTVAGTVRVTSLASGGRLHVAMDEQASEFGVAGDHIAAEVRRQLQLRFHREPSRVDCPYLRGAPGARVTCSVEMAGVRKHVAVVVSDADPTTYHVAYAVRAVRPAS